MFDRSAQLFEVETRRARSVGPTLRRLWAHFRTQGLILLVVLAAVIAGTYMQVLIPDLTGQVVDCYLTPFVAQSPAAAAADVGLIGDAAAAAGEGCWYTTPNAAATAEETIAGIGRLILIILGLFVGSAVLSGLQFYAMSVAGFRFLRDLQAAVFRHLHRLSLGYFTRHEAGEIMSRLTNDLDTLQQVIGFGLVSVAQGVLLIGWVIVRMFQLNAPFALVSLATLPLMFWSTRWFSNRARIAFRQARIEMGAVNADLEVNIAAVREVQAFSREDENIEQFRTSNAANRDANIRAQAYSSALGPALEALSYVSLAIVAVVGGLVILSGSNLLGEAISLGLIVTFIGYTQQLNRPVQQISVLWTNIQSAIAGAERIFDLMDEEPDLVDRPGAAELPPIEGHVVYADVHASYTPDEPVLHGVDIDVRPGQVIAIVGPTGAGKTTIINLLPRFMDVTAGHVEIDGHDVRDVTQHSLRRQIGIVLQDTFLFSDTVINNIRYGRPDASDEEVKAAARLACADDFINRLEHGYETRLGERGAGLSQGQRQLISIARVALANPRILILDEATSSVDTRTERQIQAALQQLLAGRTSFIIAHRLSTIRHADQVIVLDHGEVVERGTHQELLAAHGFYFDLYMSQFRREADDEEGVAALEAAAEDGAIEPGD